ncbi:MAG: PEP-CTERM sorting domain-containing protein [Moorea sp. SIO4G3]|nr:PEP-CTERM sorting domain-containing protein [Moorena sp. SIO4G3]
MARATLTNPIAQLVDVRNPANSPFSLFTVPNGDPGVDTRGVDILMESQGLGIAPGNPVTNLNPLSNDDYGGRQFLYPFVSVPEPTSILGLLTLGTLGAGSAVKKKL